MIGSPNGRCQEFSVIHAYWSGAGNVVDFLNEIDLVQDADKENNTQP
jgi:hypothetical protein